MTLLRAAAVCGAMVLAAPAFAAGADAGAVSVNGMATSPANGPTPSEQMYANAQNNQSAAVARNNATTPYSSTDSGNGVSSNSSGVATSSPRNLDGNVAGNTNGSLASQPPAAQ
ncbi:MAG TPA: hypothetical protein VGG66_02030 [Rhizomicrobium sp.]